MGERSEVDSSHLRRHDQSTLNGPSAAVSIHCAVVTSPVGDGSGSSVALAQCKYRVKRSILCTLRFSTRARNTFPNSNRPVREYCTSCAFRLALTS